MAIQDRNLSAGTTLYARYKGTTYTCEVVEVMALPKGLNPKDAPADPDPRLEPERHYRLADGREFKSPSAAGSAVMNGNACNGWAFWTVGDGTTATGPVRSSKATRPETSTVHPAPKPARKGRSARNAKAEPEASVETKASTDVECGNCGAVFGTQEEALAHMERAHSTSRDDATA
jgi:hypothetical protein